MKKILFEITTPERTMFKDEIDSVTLTTQTGEITVLPEHIPLVAPLVPGEMTIRKGNEEIAMAVAGGFVQVNPAMEGEKDRIGNRVSVLADSADRIEEIDEKEAQVARERAKNAMEEYRERDEQKFSEASGAFARAIAQLKAARRKRSRS